MSQFFIDTLYSSVTMGDEPRSGNVLTRATPFANVHDALMALADTLASSMGKPLWACEVRLPYSSKYCRT